MANWSNLYEQVPEDIVWEEVKVIPYMRLQMPDGVWVEYPLGEFFPSTPSRKLEDGQINRSIDLYDDSIKVLDWKFERPYKIPKNTPYDSAIAELLNIAGVTKQNIERIGQNTEVDIVYDGGTNFMDAINDLLKRVTYVPLFVDSNGYFTSFKYFKPTQKSPDFEFYDDEYSIIFDGVEEELDMFRVPNKFVLVHSNPSKNDVWRSVIKNTDPDSPTSIPRVGRIIVDYEEVSEVQSQQELQNMNEKRSFEKSQVYGRLMFSSALVPNFEVLDTISFGNTDLNISDKFLVVKYDMDLKVGGQMKFEVRKVVDFLAEYE